MLTQGALFAPVAACDVNQRVELVLNVLGKVWFIWSGRRSGELRPVRSHVLASSLCPQLTPLCACRASST